MKVSVPKGTRDFSPVEMVRRNFIFKTIREVFERYGYQPIETPAMENIETLTGKYGEEGDRLIFKILNSGNFLQGIPIKKDKIEDFKKWSELVVGDVSPLEGLVNPSELTRQISEKALRYDLTVPFARYVVQHQNEITFPFKRYQMQPVWRADRPQKGRYREFFQCDADVIGSDSLLNEVELVQLIQDVFKRFSLKVSISLNNRKVLYGISELIGEKEKFMDITVALDKYEKIGDKIYDELKEKGIVEEKILKLKNLIDGLLVLKSGNARIDKLKEFFKDIPIGLQGINEVEAIYLGVRKTYNRVNEPDLHFDISLARGLNYYTGTIIEVKALEGTLASSICGGGRYDDLTGIFGLKGMSGVGISFGIDRIFDVLTETEKFQNVVGSTVKALLVFTGENEMMECLPISKQLRDAGINTEIYPDLAKIKKQFDYANKKQIPFVIVVGGDEMKSGELALKNMASGEQMQLKVDAIISKLK